MKNSKSWIDGNIIEDEITHLLSERDRLLHDERRHMSGKIEADYTDELSGIHFALIRLYFRYHGIPEDIAERAESGTEWEDEDIQRMLTVLK